MDGSYSKVQFLGHVLSSTPMLIESVEDLSDRGVYLGIGDDKTDIDWRMIIVREALLAAIQAPGTSKDSDTLKIFTMPEFFWRGLKGAYHYDGKDDAKYVYIYTMFHKLISELSAKYRLSDWLIVCGSILTTNASTDCPRDIDSVLAEAGNNYLAVYDLLKKSGPNAALPSVSQLLKMLDGKDVELSADADQELTDLLLTVLNTSDGLANKSVYNRSCVFYGGGSSAIQKQYKSKEDFILNNPSGTKGTVNSYLQTMVTYPSVFDPANPVPTIPYSCFTIGNLKIGLEICLDHKRKRLLGYLGEGKIPRQDIQLVISCGMELKQEAIAVRDKGILFNCDGEYVINKGGKPDAENGDHCHSQLKTAHFDPGSGYTLSPYIPISKPENRIPLHGPVTPVILYPHGLGEIHIYDPIPV